MPRSINHIELLGRVGVEPEMRYTNGGTPVTSLRLATERPKRDGEPVTDWHSVICWGKLAEAVNVYVQKGTRIYVSGRLLQNSYNDAEGKRHTRAEVNAQEVVFLDAKQTDDDEASTTGDAGENQTDDLLPF